MLNLPIMREDQLLALIETAPDWQVFMRSFVHTMYAPRFMTISTAAVTIDETHRGAILRFTNASSVNVNLSSSLDPGFLFSFVQYGAGTLNFIGTTIGGTASIGQNTAGSCMLLDTGEWLVSGGA